jgi:hypothetical protein
LTWVVSATFKWLLLSPEILFLLTYEIIVLRLTHASSDTSSVGEWKYPTNSYMTNMLMPIHSCYASFWPLPKYLNVQYLSLSYQNMTTSYWDLLRAHLSDPLTRVVSATDRCSIENSVFSLIRIT